MLSVDIEIALELLLGEVGRIHQEMRHLCGLRPVTIRVIVLRLAQVKKWNQRVFLHRFL